MNPSTTAVKYNGNYYHQNDSPEFTGLQIRCCGFQSVKPLDNYPPKKHPKGFYFEKNAGRILDMYQFVYITEGTGTLILNKTTLKLNKGDLIYLVPGEEHSYFPDSDSGWDEYFIGLNGHAINHMVNNSFLPTQSRKITIGLHTELVTLFNSAITVSPNQNKIIGMKLYGIVMHILGLLIYQFQNNEIHVSQKTELVENAKIIIIENALKNISPNSVAKKLNLNYENFRKIFKQITGCSPATYLRLIKVQKSKQYLIESEFSVKEIAYKMNYHNLESFITTFKKNTGFTPLQYRNSCRT